MAEDAGLDWQWRRMFTKVGGSDVYQYGYEQYSRLARPDFIFIILYLVIRQLGDERLVVAAIKKETTH